MSPSNHLSRYWGSKAPQGRIKTSVSLLTMAVCLASTGVSAEESLESFLEEVVVTAQKREQNLQEVPIAVTAFSGDQLEEAVIKDIFDLQNSAPGLGSTQEQSNSSSSFRIRGVGTSGQNFGLESSVGAYVDGIYRARQSSMISDMIDVEAVEILRGPQGTLFGKNTPSGAILFRTVAPSHEPDAYASVTGGNYGQMNASAAGNLSVIDDVLALRGTVFRSSRDGTFAVEDSDAELNNRDRQGVRLQALFTPYDDLTVRLIGDYSVIDETCCGLSVLQDSVTVANGAPGTDSVIAALGGTVYEGDHTGSYQSSLSQLPESSSRDRGLSMDVSWDLDDNYTLNFITGYRKFNSHASGDVDFTNVDLLSNQSDAASTTISEEIRLDYSGESLNFVLGAYYFQQDLDLDASLSGYEDLNTFVTSGELGEFIGGTETLASLGLIAGAASSQAFLPDMVASHTSKQEHQSWAIFGQFDYDLSEEVTLTAGLRYTEEEKDMVTTFEENWEPSQPAFTSADLDSAIGALSAAGEGVFAPLFTLLGEDPTHFDRYTTPGWGGYLFSGLTPRDDINASLNDEQITGTIKLSWLATEETMVYASYGTGYKSGGTNTDRIATGFRPVFGAETSESFELGLKTEFPEQALRLNAALHYTTVDDFQANSFVGSGFVLQNAGELETYGGELEAFWVPAQNTEVSFNYAYIHAEFGSFPNAGCQIATPEHTGVAETRNADGQSCDRSGFRMAGSPEHAANLGVKQLFSLADGVEGYVYGEYTYQTDMVTGTDNDPYKLADSFGLLNLRAGLDFIDSDTIVTLWGRNILGEAYQGSTFDAPLQAGRLLTSPGAPRTYGVTVNKKF